MTNKFLIILIIVVAPLQLLAQTKTGSNKNWVINEVYVSNSPTRYGLFVEVFSPDPSKASPSLYFGTTRKDVQFRAKGKYHPDSQQKGYKAFKVSVVRFKMRTIRIGGRPDTLYLFARDGYEYKLQDAFPVVWSDTVSIGRCGNKICYFNMPTPGRENKNVNPNQFTPRRHYRASLLLGASYARNTDFLHVGYYPSVAFKIQKVVNRRTFYTGTSASIFYQGYTFNETVMPQTNNGTELIRSVDGHYSAIGLWAGKDIGLFLTPRLDISAGAGLVFGTYATQSYNETIIVDGATIKDDVKQNQTISSYGLPVLTFNVGLNYQLTSKWRIEFLHTTRFRTFAKNETEYYNSYNLGVSYLFQEKGRGYKEGAGILKYLF
jgi:hypothetical protein